MRRFTTLSPAEFLEEYAKELGVIERDRNSRFPHSPVHSCSASAQVIYGDGSQTRDFTYVNDREVVNR